MLGMFPKVWHFGQQQLWLAKQARNLGLALGGVIDHDLQIKLQTIFGRALCANSNRDSQIKLETKDVFIEITATDLTKAQIVLNTMCTMFCQYCSTPFEVEPVEVINSLGARRCKLPA